MQFCYYYTGWLFVVKADSNGTGRCGAAARPLPLPNITNRKPPFEPPVVSLDLSASREWQYNYYDTFNVKKLNMAAILRVLRVLLIRVSTCFLGVSVNFEKSLQQISINELPTIVGEPLCVGYWNFLIFPLQVRLRFLPMRINSLLAEAILGYIFIKSEFLSFCSTLL